jgi:hypothetical protein
MHFAASPIGGRGEAGFPVTAADWELVIKEYVKLGWYLASGRIVASDLVSDDGLARLSGICRISGGNG